MCLDAEALAIQEVWAVLRFAQPLSPLLATFIARIIGVCSVFSTSKVSIHPIEPVMLMCLGGACNLSYCCGEIRAATWCCEWLDRPAPL